jgi:uncharacterized protein (DUF1697 family)
MPGARYHALNIGTRGILIMARFIALLRGVNVGGNMLKMERVRELWAELGFENARTYVQSGNVVFEAKDPPAKWSQTIERALERETRLPVTVLLRTPADVGRVIANNPFLKEKGIDPAKLHVTFLSSAVAKDAVKKLSAVDAGPDRFHVVGKEVYLHCPEGYGRTKLANNRLEKALSVKATTRNWNTVNKLYEMAIQAVGYRL